MSRLLNNGILATVVVCGLILPPTWAEELHVPGAYETIQSAIDAAQPGDEVVIAPGTYMGFDNKNLDFAGKAITVRSTDPNDPAVVAATIIDCEYLGRGFHFHSGEGPDSVLAGLTIVNGHGVRDGAGVYCDESSSPTLTRCVFTQNWASYGGGISCSSCSAPLITNCLIMENVGSWNGGGISCSSDSAPAIANCLITENTGIFEGGGIWCTDSSPTLTECTITNNRADLGGGLGCTEQGCPTVNNCTITNNDAGFGGGIGCTNQSCPTVNNCTIAANTGGGGVYGEARSELTLSHTSITGNTSADGGGVCSAGFCTFVLDHCDITHNTALGEGGGIGYVDGWLECTDCVITDNTTGGRGGAIFYGFTDTVILNRCTIARNTASEGGGVYGFEGNLTLNQCAITDNTALDGPCGGIGTDSGSTGVLTDCTISQNTAAGDGGGVYWSAGGSATLLRCTINGNTAYRGAGAYGRGSAATLADCTVTSNTAEAEGGALECNASPFWPAHFALMRCTLFGNSAAQGAVLACDGQHPSDVSFSNSILRSEGTAIWNNDGSTINITYSDINGGWPGDGNIDEDPLFVDPASGDFHLSPDSPCIDAGDPAFVPAPGESDLDGQYRLWDGDGNGVAIVDMGADEFGSYVFGDLNCDGAINNLDVSALLLAVTNPETYAEQYPNCNVLLGDLTSDGLVNNFDIGPFIALLTRS
ncbi:MAG: right-handed parallel beta-helix repeat-containing protein [Phycisphaerae bacterium]|jgi:hypothetical protein